MLYYGRLNLSYSHLIYAFDTYYTDDKAHTICLAFPDWRSEQETKVFEELLDVPSEYESGSFYKRELPCILSLLTSIPLENGDLIIVDGYVTLDDKGTLGLGGHLYHVLGQQYPIVGIAKNGYAESDSGRMEVLRGESKKPLYLTSVGIPTASLVKEIKAMHGAYRIPTLLKKLDQLTRQF